ncbi:MAG: hypothetical protein ABSG91_20460 [Syntrophobacteraceae bacterium]|jgi:hypothetical protein
MRNKSEVLSIAAFFLIFVLLAGCASQKTQPVQQVIEPPPLFPPVSVMRTGDYAGFFTENTEALKSCQDPDKCAIALFNLSFLYCYSKSPYYDPRKGLKHIEDLIKAAPESPLAYQAMVWKDLIEKGMKKKSRKRPAREDTKAKAAPEPEPDESAGQAEPSQEGDWEVDRKRLEDEIRSKEEIIGELNRQIERSRQIDIEIEKKERGLLY